MMSLNPSCDGTDSQTLCLNCIYSRLKSLNPSCDGTDSQTISNRTLKLTDKEVLILLVMELTLRLKKNTTSGVLTNVLILLVMELTLRQY